MRYHGKVLPFNVYFNKIKGKRLDFFEEVNVNQKLYILLRNIT